MRSRPRTLRSERWGGGQAPKPGRAKVLWAVPIVIVAFVAGFFLGRPSAGTAADSDPVAAMKKQDAQRDNEQIGTLTQQARRMHDGLLPVLEGLTTTTGTREQVTGWQKITKGYVDEFAERPSAGTAVNIARSGLASSVQQLDLAVETYAKSVDAQDKQPWLETAGRQRDAAIVTWSVAATQLDVLNVDSGRGHAHIFLPSKPGQGALTSDGSPEGPR
ncbi:hypothetical protein LWC34_12965 [Kibdelosporangium philippinense]|uniref:LemA family protein n=1 Tax=Kibdelosporangium philippinense TaxID=211113 RepID=A0ABS8ZAA2_9PSEU|nr:hypothetical protein [Kibdelosporangium philippinense]MCE7003730.1 hypothetical protein [Kibdelosporangium philippinense]